MEKKLNEKFTCCEIIKGLKDINFYEVKGEGFIPTYIRTDITDALHEIFGFRTDYSDCKYKLDEKNFKDTKNKKIRTFINTKKSLKPL